MVKQAEKIKQRNPLLPIFGIIIAGGLGVIAYLIMDYLIGPSHGLPILKGAIDSLGQYYNLGRWGVVLAIWLVFLGIAYMLVSLLIGKDPDSPKDIPMPPRDIKTRRQK